MANGWNSYVEEAFASANTLSGSHLDSIYTARSMRRENTDMYHIAGYFWRVFILGYFEEASFFENKFFVIAKKQHVIAPHVININIS